MPEEEECRGAGSGGAQLVLWPFSDIDNSGQQYAVQGVDCGGDSDINGGAVLIDRQAVKILYLIFFLYN